MEIDKKELAKKRRFIYIKDKFRSIGINSKFWEAYVVPIVLKRDGYKCQKEGCNATKYLDVAHKVYHPEITINDLITLCRKHHKEFDKEGKK